MISFVAPFALSRHFSGRALPSSTRSPILLINNQYVKSSGFDSKTIRKTKREGNTVFQIFSLCSGPSSLLFKKLFEKLELFFFPSCLDNLVSSKQSHKGFILDGIEERKGLSRSEVTETLRSGKRLSSLLLFPLWQRNLNFELTPNQEEKGGSERVRE